MGLQDDFVMGALPLSLVMHPPALPGTPLPRQSKPSRLRITVSPSFCAPPPPAPSPGAVPLVQVVQWWEPTDTTALVLRAVVVMKEALYWALIVALPVAGWTLLFPSLIYLKFSK